MFTWMRFLIITVPSHIFQHQIYFAWCGLLTRCRRGWCLWRPVLKTVPVSAGWMSLCRLVVPFEVLNARFSVCCPFVEFFRQCNDILCSLIPDFIFKPSFHCSILHIMLALKWFFFFFIHNLQCLDYCNLCFHLRHFLSLISNFYKNLFFL